jgi:hypothetical protein
MFDLPLRRSKDKEGGQGPTPPKVAKYILSLVVIFLEIIGKKTSQLR